MQKMKIGIITYDIPHLKTEQLLCNLICMGGGGNLIIYALPFIEREERVVLFPHRPYSKKSVSAESIAIRHRIPYRRCLSDMEIDGECDVYLVAGSNILSKKCVESKRIINAHPGIIPMVRGLDSFKWAIYEDKPLGVTLHYLNEETDKGEIISIMQTFIYEGDTIETLARRHYENEIYMLSNFLFYLENPTNYFVGIQECESKRRMGIVIEREMLNKVPLYVQRWKV